MKLFKMLLIIMSSMLFMAFVGYAGGSKWGEISMGWLLFGGGIIPLVMLLLIGYLDGDKS